MNPVIMSKMKEICNSIENLIEMMCALDIEEKHDKEMNQMYPNSPDMDKPKMKQGSVVTMCKRGH